jgi:hypothetical protein
LREKGHFERQVNHPIQKGGYAVTKQKWLLLAFSIGLGMCASIALLASLGGSGLAAAQSSDAPVAGDYVLLGWNDLGMHCYNRDFQNLAVLPPYNNLWAQVIKRGDPPQIVTTGIEVTYVFTDNTYSVGKSNFWTYAQAIFGLPNPLPANIGLTGKGLSGSMDLNGDHFQADGIPLTEFSDSAPTTPQPFQLATIIAKDTNTLAVLATAKVVAPVSTEMRCDECHCDTCEASGDITPTGKVETNILTLHDKEELSHYPPGYGPLMQSQPVLCANCHASNALGKPGLPGIKNLSNAMHGKHAEEGGFPNDTSGCYKCHPGPTTKCLRDVMSTKFGYTCQNCHGDLLHVSQNPDPWLNEPRCDTCHGSVVHMNDPLYRHSKGHSGVYCEGCHDSTHAIAQSSQPRDATKFIDLQGYAGTLNKCTVCHLTQPVGAFMHAQLPGGKYHAFLPTIR